MLLDDPNQFMYDEPVLSALSDRCDVVDCPICELEARIARLEEDHPDNISVAEPNTGTSIDGSDQCLKKDAGKLRIELIPSEVIEAMATVLAFGAKKYAPRAWESGKLEPERIWAAAQRHLWEYHKGRRIDDESGFPTLWHALTEVAFLVTYEMRGLIKDDQ